MKWSLHGGARRSRIGRSRIAGEPGQIQAPQSLSQWQLIRRRFARHKLAAASLYVVSLMYLIAAFAEVFAPYPRQWRDLSHTYAPPQLPRFSLDHGLYVYGLRQRRDPVTFEDTYVEDRGEVIPLGLFVKGEPYEFWGLLTWDRHLVGADPDRYRKSQAAIAREHAPDLPSTVPAGEAADRPLTRGRRPASLGRAEPPKAGPREAPNADIPRLETSVKGRPRVPTFYMLGADRYGHDILSRIIYGLRISLSIGLVAIAVTFILGVAVGGVSGYVGGSVDNVIQRGIEIINSFPRLPLWLALGAALPRDWSPLRIYFGITIVLALLGWTGLARVVRGKLLSLREEDYATAARLLGASHGRIIFRHLLPGFTSHIIVSLTLRVPVMILGETSLSFLGLGLRPPVVSWGVMLQDCMNMQVVSNYPWLLMPVVFIILVVLGCNFLGDGLRDAADPYSGR